MASTQELFRNRLEHLIQAVMFNQCTRALFAEYNQIEDEWPQLADTLERLPTEFPEKFLSLSITELTSYMKDLCEKENCFYEQMDEVWGDDEKHNFDLYWLDYDLSIIADFYYERHTTTEEAFLNIVGLKQVKTAKETLAQLVKNTFYDCGEIPDDLLIFLRSEPQILRNRLEYCLDFADQSTHTLTQKLVYPIGNHFQILL